MAMIHVINGQLKVVEDFNGKRPNTKSFYLNGEVCILELDKKNNKLIIKNEDNILLELDIK